MTVMLPHSTAPAQMSAVNRRAGHFFLRGSCFSLRAGLMTVTGLFCSAYLFGFNPTHIAYTNTITHVDLRQAARADNAGIFPAFVGSRNLKLIRFSRCLFIEGPSNARVVAEYCYGSLPSTSFLHPHAPLRSAPRSVSLRGFFLCP